MDRQRDKRAVGPEPAIRDEELEMEVRMPVRARTRRLQAGDDPDRDVALAGQRADRRGDGALGAALGARFPPRSR